MLKKIGFLQFAVQFGQRAANFAHVDDLLRDAPEIDLLVLPELAFTGYDFIDKQQVAQFAEPTGDGPTSQFLKTLAARHNAVVIAGYPEAAGDYYFNSSMMALPDGAVYNYRKIHLFSRENDLFSPGDSPPCAIDTPAGRVGMMICFDWFFPETARLLALDGAQIIAHPSNLVLPWCQRAMFARSVENHVFSITANRIGTETQAGRNLTFTGGSQVLNPTGVAVATANSDDESLGIIEVDISEADNKQINPYNNLIASRRVELYGGLLP